MLVYQRVGENDLQIVSFGFFECLSNLAPDGPWWVPKGMAPLLFHSCFFCLSDELCHESCPSLSSGSSWSIWPTLTNMTIHFIAFCLPLHKRSKTTQDLTFIHSDGLNRMLTPICSGPSGIDPRWSKAIGSSDTTKRINIWIFTAQSLCFQSSSGSFPISMGFQNVGLGGATGVARSDCARWEGFSLGARQPYLEHVGPSARGHHGNHL